MCWLLVFGLLVDVSVVIAEGKRPVSFRTRKLSPPAPMVLHSGGCGRVGRRRTQRDSRAHPNRGGPYCYLGSIASRRRAGRGSSGHPNAAGGRPKGAVWVVHVGSGLVRQC